MLDQTQTDPAPAMDSSHSDLIGYLAGHDVPCPGCGYNLRGTQDSRCPECGGPIELGLKGAGGKGWLLFLILALGWVTLAAGMHTARTVIAARNEARVFSGFQVLLSSGATFSSGGAATRVPTVIGQPLIATTAPPGSGGRMAITGRPSPIVAAGGISTNAGPVTITRQPSGSLSVVTRSGGASNSNTLAWSQVQAQTWVSLGFAAVLALAAAIVLFLILLRRHRIIHAGPSRPIITFALVVFGLYAAGQVFLFVRELTG